MGSIALATRLWTKLSAVSKLGVGLGEFESKADIDSLNIPTLAKRIQNEALELWELLASLIEQQHASRRDTLTEYQGSMVMICSILA